MILLSSEIAELMDHAHETTRNYIEGDRREYPASDDAVAIVTGLRAVVSAIQGLTLQLEYNRECSIEVHGTITTGYEDEL